MKNENAKSFELYYKEEKFFGVKEYCAFNSNYKDYVFFTNEYKKDILNKRLYLNICGE